MQIERNRMDQTRLLELLVHNTTIPAAGSDTQYHGGFVNFLKTDPPKFSRAEDPLVADDWLHNVERMEPAHGMRSSWQCSHQIVRSRGRVSARLSVLLTFQMASWP